MLISLIVIGGLLSLLVGFSIFGVLTFLEILDEVRIIKRQLREVLTKELLTDLQKISDLEKQKEKLQ